MVRVSKDGIKFGFQKGNKTGPRFKDGHKGYWKGKKRPDRLGANHPNWAGGRLQYNQDYVRIYKPNHPFCDKAGYIKEHRLIVERYLGRFLKLSEHCHHRNDIRTDNHPENLMAFSSHSAHHRFHHNPDNVKPEEIIFNGKTAVLGER